MLDSPLKVSAKGATRGDTQQNRGRCLPPVHPVWWVYPAYGHDMVLCPRRLERADSRAKAGSGSDLSRRHAHLRLSLEAHTPPASCLWASLRPTVGRCLALVHQVPGSQHPVGCDSLSSAGWQLPEEVPLMLPLLQNKVLGCFSQGSPRERRGWSRQQPQQ